MNEAPHENDNKIDKNKQLNKTQAYFGLVFRLLYCEHEEMPKIITDKLQLQFKPPDPLYNFNASFSHTDCSLY